MSEYYFVYDALTGQIVNRFTKRHDVPPDIFIEDDLIVLIGDPDPATQYMADGFITQRPTFPITVSETTVAVGEDVIFSGVPLDTRINAKGINDVMDDPDGKVAWSSNIAGVFNVAFRLFPYRDLFFRIEVLE